ncbi:hypothetical protein EXT68_16445 [Pectobacterium parmentieri]|uniref:Uncharacterized protein n=1 Tax=Pectobacterium parmentieri TaxID=1905730 RepID=A0A0H3I328_PECPM|nr:hypothetical protein [Pectobacterium parmentieri]AFI88195.1 Hypothetical protein W5S_0056 [Pectobacterium parmentieri]MBI0469655.1 hypothetical protein [Pectobacterium parmentieri]MBI0494845.1 hypothetical protein [Pectobacterium parmentieri]MBI0553393.1 hypothetical protein [Pectobacterium parmentieri]MBI0569260.1 hypothetical protein [Pectobacterium parmentieri]
MKPILWDLAGFNISMKSQYADIYALERDIRKNFGSSNFSEMDSLDWFLSDKITGQTSFLLLTIPSVLKESFDNPSIDINSLSSINLSDCVHDFSSNVSIQNEATYFIKNDELLVASNTSLIFYKVLISDELYFLLDKDFTYQGFLLMNATSHIYGYEKSSDNEKFKPLLLRMIYFCSQESYDAIENMDTHYLFMMNKLEEDCHAYKEADMRVLQIIDFIKNIKDIFYDIETDTTW